MNVIDSSTDLVIATTVYVISIVMLSLSTYQDIILFETVIKVFYLFHHTMVKRSGSCVICNCILSYVFWHEIPVL